VNSGNTGYLANPQNLNSYSYVNNNPLRYTDPTGKCPNCATALAGGIVGGIYGLADQYLTDVGNNLISGQSLGSALIPNFSNEGWGNYMTSIGADTVAGAAIGFYPPSAIPVLLTANGAKNYQRTGAVDPLGAISNTAVDLVVPPGTDKLVGAVTGPELSVLSRRILTSAHTQRALLTNGISTFVNNAGTVAGGYIGSGGGGVGGAVVQERKEFPPCDLPCRIS
jgi:hypothetical protein